MINTVMNRVALAVINGAFALFVLLSMSQCVDWPTLPAPSF